MEELQRELEFLREELRKREAEHEEELLQAQQQHSSNLRSHVSSSVMMIRLQKQLDEKSNAVSELGARFLQLQQAKQSLTLCHQEAMQKVEELSGLLKEERMKILELEKELQTSNMSRIRMTQLQERINELEQERDQLKENNEKLVNSALDVSPQLKAQVEEQKLRLQICQLEEALKADLLDKNEILDKIKAERETNERLAEENQKLQIQFVEQQQQVQELKERLKFYNKEGDYDVTELTEALLLIKKRQSQRGDLEFLKEGEEEEERNTDISIRKLRAAHAETIQELEKTRNLLGVESRISKDYKMELEAAVQKMNAEKSDHKQKLEHQAHLLDTRAAKIRKLEAQLRDIAYGTRSYVSKPGGEEEEEEDLEETLLLEGGENLVELQIVSASFSAAALQVVGETDPSTFCTYSFYWFEPHSTPVVMGVQPQYGFTSRFVVSMDESFLGYLQSNWLSVELHQSLGLDWKTLASGRIRLQGLLEDGRLQGSVPLVGCCEEARAFGSVDYLIKMKIPLTETLRLKAVDYMSSTLSQPSKSPPSSSRNELLITVQSCSGLQSRTSQYPSSYVVYRFFNFSDYPTSTVNDHQDPRFNDVQSYSIVMDPELHSYLQSECLLLYVFDYKEEQMDTYLGKARIPLTSLTRNQTITGFFELNDPSGLPAGQIEVMLKWKLTYITPPNLKEAEEDSRLSLTATQFNQKQEEEQEDNLLKDVEEILKEKEEKLLLPSSHEALPPLPASLAKIPQPKERLTATIKDGATAKKVKFVDPTEDRVCERESEATHSLAKEEEKMDEEEEEEEESHLSDGQLVQTSTQSDSDDSEISEEITNNVEDVHSAPPDQNDSDQSNSDDCIIQRNYSQREVSDRLQVEIVSLSLSEESRVSRDQNVVGLFVEYSLLDLPVEETPLSLPKPPPGRSINFNCSKVVPVDSEKNGARRRLLREVLQGKNPDKENIRFTVVSEPPEEQQQDTECEDVGVAFLRISDLLERQEDLLETSLNVVCVEDSSELVGSLKVSLKGLKTLQSILEDKDKEEEA